MVQFVHLHQQHSRSWRLLVKIGDLVMKVDGYGSNEKWTGIILGYEPLIQQPTTKYNGKIIVLTTDGIETWVLKFCEVINETR